MTANFPKMAFWGALLMALAVILGALGAHALKDVLTAGQLDSFQTGVRYHLIHGLAILLLCFVPTSNPKRRRLILRLFFLGIAFFSFSIYLLALRDVLGISSLAKILGPITPIGGLLFVSAWILTAFELRKTKSVQ